MDNEKKKLLGRERAKAWREANPERFKAAIEKCKAAKPEKYKQLQRAYYLKYKEHSNAVSAAWREANQEKNDALVREWVKKHPERRREIANNWRKRNPDKVNAVYARRRAAKKNAVPKWANQFFISEIYDLARRRSELKTGGHEEWHVD